MARPLSIEVAALAQGGAQVLAAAMATEAWTQVRDRVARLFGGADPKRQETLDQLDEARTTLAAASTEQDAHTAAADLPPADFETLYDPNQTRLTQAATQPK